MVQEFEIMQDNDRKHINRLDKKNIKRKKDHHLQLSSWLEQSVHLNLVEVVLGELDQIHFHNSCKKSRQTIFR